MNENPRGHASLRCRRRVTKAASTAVGLHGVDYETQERTPKLSADFFRRARHRTLSPSVARGAPYLPDRASGAADLLNLSPRDPGELDHHPGPVARRPTDDPETGLLFGGDRCQDSRHEVISDLGSRLPRPPAPTRSSR
jgi:hypothetical protein